MDKLKFANGALPPRSSEPITEKDLGPAREQPWRFRVIMEITACREVFPMGLDYNTLNSRIAQALEKLEQGVRLRNISSVRMD